MLTKWHSAKAGETPAVPVRVFLTTFQVESVRKLTGNPVATALGSEFVLANTWHRPSLLQRSWTEADWLCFRRKSHQFANGIEDNRELAIVFLFQLVKLACQFDVGNQHPTQLNKGPHDLNGCLNSPLAVKDICSHDGAVFCED
jgi:hypothetical protein